jgi:hypothetical protein
MKPTEKGFDGPPERPYKPPTPTDEAPETLRSTGSSLGCRVGHQVARKSRPVTLLASAGSFLENHI